MFEGFIKFTQNLYKSTEFIPLHAPKFNGNEKKYLNKCIDSTFVSSVGEFVDKLEENIASYTGAKYAIATNNGTSALHIALLLANVSKGDEVITQPLTFVATCNSISYCNANPVFVDIDRDSMGMSPESLLNFLESSTSLINQQCINNSTGKVIRACVPMHTFGHPCRIDTIRDICNQYYICLIEDACESLGSVYKGKHTGTFGKMGVFSFNGNKIVTAGGGGCLITNDENLAKRAKHLTTTSKKSHKWEFVHDEVGYNYRMPNINAALIVAQLEQLEDFIKKKEVLSNKYLEFFKSKNIEFVSGLKESRPNFWLNTIIFKEEKYKDLFINESNSKGVMTRPVWMLMNKLSMFKNAQSADLRNAEWLEKRVVNIPSGVVQSK